MELSFASKSLTNVKDIIHRSLQEDIGEGDRTTEALKASKKSVLGKLIAKEPGIISGLKIAELTFQLLDGNIQFSLNCQDGEKVECGDQVATVQGTASTILSGERVALNYLQRMSGIATITNQFVQAVAGTQAVILDTRKTAPGLRMMDKWAVRSGGGENHRFGLYDMVLIKENHIKLAGSITEAVKQVLTNREENNGKQLAIEVEVKNLTEFQEALGLGVDRILLDNMNIDKIREAVKMTKGNIPLEVSGNVTLDNVRSIAETGVDYISIGMLTHSAKALDISLLIY